MFLLLGLVAIATPPDRSTAWHAGAQRPDSAGVGREVVNNVYVLHLGLGLGWQAALDLSNPEDQPIEMILSTY